MVFSYSSQNGPRQALSSMAVTAHGSHLVVLFEKIFKDAFYNIPPNICLPGLTSICGFQNYTLIRRNHCFHIQLSSRYLIWMCNRHLELKMCKAELLIWTLKPFLTTSQIMASYLLQRPKSKCGAVFGSFCFSHISDIFNEKTKSPSPICTAILSSASHHYQLLLDSCISWTGLHTGFLSLLIDR